MSEKAIPENSLVKPGAYVSFTHQTCGHLAGLVVDVYDVPEGGRHAQVVVSVLCKNGEMPHVEHWQRDSGKPRHLVRVESHFVSLAACVVV